MPTRATAAASDSDDEAPVAISLSAARKGALKREADAPSVVAAKAAQKAAEKKQQGIVTANLRGDDYLPPEILSQLPTAPLRREPEPSIEPANSRKRARSADAATPKLLEKPVQAPTGLPRVVNKFDTVEIAVIDGVEPSRPRLHAPVSAGVRDFMQQQLYGKRISRAPAATLSSLKAAGGRFGPASNFASSKLAAADPVQPARKGRQARQRGNNAQTVNSAGQHSSLEQMAAKIMRKAKQR